MIRTILKRYEFWIFLAIGFVLLFSFYNSAHAQTLIFNQQYQKDGTYFGRASINTWCIEQSYKASETFDLGSVDIVFSKNNTNSITMNASLRVKGGWNNTTVLATSTNTIARNNITQTDNCIASETCNYYTFEFDGNLTFVQDNYYYFELFTDTRDNTNFIYAGNSGDIYDDPYALGHREGSSGGNCLTGYTGLSEPPATEINRRDFTMKIYEAPPTYILDWIFPVDSTSTVDFGFWRFNYATPADSYIIVEYWNDDDQEYTDTGGLFLASEEETEKAVLKSNALSYGTWNAIGYLVSDDYLITYAQTDAISFTITTSTPAIPPIEASSTCSGLGWIGEPMCNLAFILFVPKQSSLNNFVNLKTQLENKPPFGYATQIYGALTGFASSTATSTINFSNFENLPSYTTPLKTTLTIIIWLAFGFWLFARLRHFEF